jgi:hypothetical protein
MVVEGLVAFGIPMGQIKAKDIHTRGHELVKGLGIRGGRPEGGYDLGSLSIQELVERVDGHGE